MTWLGAARRRPLWQHLLVLVLLLACFWATQKRSADTGLPPLVVADASLSSHGSWEYRFASDVKTRLVHAASLLELPDGRLRAFWFAGSREGAADVTINTSVFDPDQGEWSDEQVLITRQWLQAVWGRPVRKLGNAVPVREADGSLRLFLVAVSFGGWAASRTVLLRSDDQGHSWTFVRELRLSPFLNISTLVKTSPIRYQDGSLGLPAYHEFIGKFGELVRLDNRDRIRNLLRISWGQRAIQPVLLPTSATDLAAFLRPADKFADDYLLTSHSVDGGQHWARTRLSSLENPGSAASGLALTPTHWLLVSNCNRIERDDLCLKETRNAGQDWQKLWQFHDRESWRGKPLDFAAFEKLLASDRVQPPDASADLAQLDESVRINKCKKNAECQFQFDYPYLIQASNGDLHVLYTWNKSIIRHAWFRVTTQEKKAGG